MRSIFDLVKSQFVSVFSTLLIFSFFIVFLVSFIVSDRVTNSFLSSEYFKQKLKEELLKYDIVFEKVNVLNVDNFRNTKISIKNLSHSNNASLKVGKTAVEIDLLSLFLRANYINELTVEELFFNMPSQEKSFFSSDIESLTRDLSFSFKKIISKTKTKSFLIKSVFIQNSTSNILLENLKFREYGKTQEINGFLTFSDIEKKNFITSGFRLKTQDNFSTISFSSDLKLNQPFFSQISSEQKEIVNVADLLGIADVNLREVSLEGVFDFNSKKLTIDVSSEANESSLKLRLHVDELIKKNQLLISNLTATFQDREILIEKFIYERSSNKFVLEIKELNIKELPEKLTSLKVNGVIDFDNDSRIKFKIFWGLDEAEKKFGNVEIEQLEKENRFSLKFETKDSLKIESLAFLKQNFKNSNFGKIGAEVSGVKIDTIVGFKNGSISIDKIGTTAKTISIFLDNNQFVVMDKFLFKKDKEQGTIEAERISQFRYSPAEIYKFHVDFGKLNSFQDESDFTVSLITNSNNFVELLSEQIFNKKIKKPWFISNLDINKDNKLNLIYTNKASIENFESFLKFENAVYEIKLDQYFFKSNNKNTIHFNNIELIGFGDNISFELKNSGSDQIIEGTASNFINSINQKNFNNLNLFINDLKIQSFITEPKFVITEGPININLSSIKENGQNVIFGKIDLSSAEIIFPNFFVNKKKNDFAELSFRLLDKKKFKFSYKQKDIFLKGSIDHDEYLQINKITFSDIRIPNLIRGRAEYRNFSDHKEFNLKNATVDMSYLKKLKIKKRKKPLDIVFKNVSLKSNSKIIMENIKGEIRVYNGIRGYANSRDSNKNETYLTFTPNKNNQTEILISSKNAGNFLKKSQFYQNGYGGRIHIILLYKNKDNIEGKFNIDNLRVRKAPVLAQLISAISVVGLVDTLNGVGLLFSKIEGNFSYKDNKLELFDGTAVGPSIGLTMSGFEKFNAGDNEVRVEGLISPIYIINGVIKSIPIIGKVLGGEKGEGVFGMAYKVEGNSKKPRVFVNPLSIITPGAFRNIFKLND